MAVEMENQNRAQRQQMQHRQQQQTAQYIQQMQQRQMAQAQMQQQMAQGFMYQQQQADTLNAMTASLQAAAKGTHDIAAGIGAQRRSLVRQAQEDQDRRDRATAARNARTSATYHTVDRRPRQHEITNLQNQIWAVEHGNRFIY